MNVLIGFTASVGSILAPKIVYAFRAAGFDVGTICTPKTIPAFTNSNDLEAAGAQGFYSDNSEWSWERAEAGAGVVQGYNGDGEKIYFSETWQKGDAVKHIELREKYDMLVVAPMSANTLGKMTVGICDNLLTSVLLAWKYKEKPVVIAPAMNTEMWESPITQANLKRIQILLPNITIVSPQEKMLACGTMGNGALANIDDIVAASLHVYNSIYK